MITQTIYSEGETTRKQLTMPNWAYQALERSSSGRLTNSFIAYEALLLAMPEYEDDFSKIESGINEVFVQEVGEDSLEYINHADFADAELGEMKLAKAVVEEDGSAPYQKCSRVNILFPTPFNDQLDEYELGYEIADALARVHELPWASRIERTNVKQELIQHARGESLPDPHPFTNAVIKDESDQWDIEPVLNDLKYDDWWESPKVTFDMIAERGDEIPQTHRWRVPALQTALNNSDAPITREDVEVVIQEDIGVLTPSTVDRYLDELDFSQKTNA